MIFPFFSFSTSFLLLSFHFLWCTKVSWSINFTHNFLFHCPFANNLEIKKCLSYLCCLSTNDSYFYDFRNVRWKNEVKNKFSRNCLKRGGSGFWMSMFPRMRNIRMDLTKNKINDLKTMREVTLSATLSSFNLCYFYTDCC